MRYDWYESQGIEVLASTPEKAVDFLGELVEMAVLSAPKLTMNSFNGYLHATPGDARIILPVETLVEQYGSQ
ncbi:MAG: hypothetical protein ABIA93_07995 [Candidatus Woesearchaeota archaeon]